MFRDFGFGVVLVGFFKKIKINGLFVGNSCPFLGTYYDISISTRTYDKLKVHTHTTTTKIMRSQQSRHNSKLQSFVKIDSHWEDLCEG